MNTMFFKGALFVLVVIYCSILANAQTYSVGNTPVTFDVDGTGNAVASIPVFCPPGRLSMQPQLNINYNSGSGNGLLGRNMSLGGTSVISRTGNNYHINGRQDGVVLDNTKDNFELDGNRLIWIGGAAAGTSGSIYRTEADQFAKITFYNDNFIAELKDGGVLFYGNGGNSRLVPSGANTFQATAFYLYRKYDIDGNYIEYNYQMPGGQIQLTEIKYTGFDCTLNATRTCSLYPAVVPFNRIAFTYKSAISSNKLWVNATSLVEDKILEKIEVFESTNKVRQYDFEYTNNVLHDYLASVQEKNSAGEALQPVTFTWKNDGADLAVSQNFPTPNMSNADYTQTLAGDFNGDGKSDLLLIEGVLELQFGYRLSSNSIYRIYTTNTTNRAIVGQVINNGKLLNNNAGSAAVQNISNVQAGDLNQDGLDDLLLQTIDFMWHSNGSMDYYLHYHAMLARIDQTGKLQFDIALDYFASSNKTNIYPQYDFFGTTSGFDRLVVTPYLTDCDGDGLTDLVEISKKQERDGKCFFRELEVTYGNNRTSKYLLSYSALGQRIHSEMMTDFNGNGKADIMIVYNTTSDVLELTANNSSYIYLYSSGFPQGLYHKSIQPGDFNGDGKTDLLYYSDRWNVAYGKSNGWEGYDASTLWGVSNLSPDHGYNPNYAGTINELPWKAGILFQIGDFNGDGKADILERHFHPVQDLNGHTENTKIMYYSKGYGFHKVYLGTNPNTSNDFDYSYSLLADFDGDGKTDIFSREYATSAIAKSSFKSTIEYFDGWMKRIDKIQPNLTATHIFKFKPLPQSLQFKKETKLKFDQAVALSSRQWITEEYSYNVTATSIVKTYKYYYYNLLFHRHGRGLMGFLQTAVIDMHPTPDMRTAVLTENKQDPELTYKLQPYRIKTLKAPVVLDNFVESGEVLTQQEFTWSSIRTISNQTILQQSPSAKLIHFPYTSKIEEWNYLKQVKKSTCYEYDINGNLLLSKVAFYVPGNYTQAEHITTISNQYEQKGSWLPSVLKKTQTTALRYDAGVLVTPYTNQMEFVNNGRNKILQTMKFTDNQALYVSDYFTYDGYGNVLSQKIDYVANTSGTPITTTIYTYSSNGRFLNTAKNVLNQITTFTYEPVYGNKLTETTAADFTTTYEYDLWGRNTKVISPEGKVTSITIAWNTTSLPAFVTGLSCAYYIQIENTLGEKSWEYYDNADRKIASKKTGFGNAFTYTDVQFDSDNRINKVSNTYATKDDKLYTETSYDPYGRIFQEKFNGVLMTKYGYEKTSVAVIAKIEGRDVVKTSTAYATGHAAKVTDSGGDIVYKLGSHNLPLSIIAGGTTTTMTYDAALRKTQLCDPNAGCIQYEYNALGQLSKQADARGNEYSMEYDLAGKLTTKTGGNNEEYIYTFYDNVGKGKLNKLRTAELKMNGSTIHSVTYDYGDKGELLSIQEEAPGAYDPRITTYNYDANYRVKGMTYPKLKLSNTYDATNNHTAITLIEKNGTPVNIVLWTKTAEMPDGRTWEFELGNGFKHTNYFDMHQQLSQIYCAQHSISGPEHIAINTKYAFELQSGNLTDKLDYSSPVGNEQFLYDNSDRLIAIRQMNKPAYGGSGFRFPYFRDVPNYTYEIAYGNNGNITGKFDAGSLTYDETHPNAVKSNEYNKAMLSPRITPPHYSEEQSITYNAFNKVTNMSQLASLGTNTPVEINFVYGVSEQRIKMEITENSSVTNTTHYINSAGMELVNGDEITYIYAEGEPIAMHRVSDNVIYYLHVDYQGSLIAISNEEGTVVERRSYDAWGRPRRVDNYEYKLPSPFGGSASTYTLRGYTFHEHLEMIGHINMNGRIYDPVLGRMLSSDNYVQDATSTQNFNRYSYCVNNPTKYTDPDGNLIVAAIIIGATVGAYYGGRMANDGQANPTKWDYQSGKTWGYMAGGAVVGGASGYIGGTIAASGAPMANTMSLMFGSSFNSMGMYTLSNGKSGLSMSFGIASYNATNNEWGYLGKKGNSGWENFGYALGGLANVSDVLAGFKPGEVQLNTEKSDAIGHSALTKVGETDPNNSLVSVGPDPGGKWIFNPFKMKNGTNHWNNYVDAGNDLRTVGIKGINLQRITSYGAKLNRGVNYNLYFSSCVNHTARALTLAGAPSIGIHPFILHSQMVLRSIGIRPTLYSYYLYQN